jgi:hypothetical protein
MGLLSITSLMIMNMNSQLSHANQKLQLLASSPALVEDIKKILSDQAVCSLNFAGQKATAETGDYVLTEIKDISTTVYKQDEKYLGVKFENAEVEFNKTPFSNQDRELYLRFKNGKATQIFRIQIKISFNPGGDEIASCQTIVSNPTVNGPSLPNEVDYATLATINVVEWENDSIFSCNGSKPVGSLSLIAGTIASDQVMVGLSSYNAKYNGGLKEISCAKLKSNDFKIDTSACQQITMPPNKGVNVLSCPKNMLMLGGTNDNSKFNSGTNTKYTCCGMVNKAQEPIEIDMKSCESIPINQNPLLPQDNKCPGGKFVTTVAQKVTKEYSAVNQMVCCDATIQ